MPNKSLTLIFPVDFSRRENEILARVKSQCHFAVKNNLSVVFGHNNRQTKTDFAFLDFIKNINSAYISVSSYAEVDLNLSRARNIACEKILTKYLLLLDIDVFLSSENIDLMYLKCQKQEVKFVMFPCLYLTQKGTKLITSNQGEAHVIESFFARSNRYVQHLAIPSSVLMMETDLYKKIDGFDEDYVGHGYEDFDFMLRLFQTQGMQVTEKLLLDETYKAPLLSNGFRSVFAHACLDSVIDKTFAFHAFHKKNRDDSYYAKRIENARKFQLKIERELTKNYFNNTVLLDTRNANNEFDFPDLIFTFLKKINTAGKKPGDYLVLFGGIVGHGFKKQMVINTMNIKIEILGAIKWLLQKN